VGRIQLNFQIFFNTKCNLAALTTMHHVLTFFFMGYYSIFLDVHHGNKVLFWMTLLIMVLFS